MNIIEDSRKGAFKSSVQSIFSAYETYELKNNFEVEGKVDILDLPLTHKENFISGKVYKDGSTIKIENVSNGAYCASGTLEELQITDGECKPPIPTLAEKISSLLGTIDTVIAADPDQNIRYAGNTNYVDNYISFNNEVWRIIGVFDGKVKIIRNEPIAEMKWNEEEKSDWASSSLYNYLNTEYYNSIDSTYKNMVENATWRTGGWEKVSVMPQEIYEYEGTQPGIFSTSPITTGYVGLMSASDFGYASSGCYIGKQHTLAFYDNDTCRITNWMRDYSGWTLTIISHATASGFVVGGTGKLIDLYLTITSEIRPSIYLKKGVYVTGGTGTSSDPYTIVMD